MHILQSCRKWAMASDYKDMRTFMTFSRDLWESLAIHLFCRVEDSVNRPWRHTRPIVMSLHLLRDGRVWEHDWQLEMILAFGPFLWSCPAMQECKMVQAPSNWLRTEQPVKDWVWVPGCCWGNASPTGTRACARGPVWSQPRRAKRAANHCAMCKHGQCYRPLAVHFVVEIELNDARGFSG